MPDDNVYDVSSDYNGWGLERRGAQRTSGRFDTKKEAVKRGRELASKQKGRLVIRSKTAPSRRSAPTATIHTRRRVSDSTLLARV